MDGMIFYKNVFGNTKRRFLGIKEISCTQQFKIILKKIAYERSVK